MLESLKKKILENDVISFDMFDTLVFRTVDNPEVLFDLIGKKFKIKDFRKIRHNMQADLGGILQQTKNYPHANMDEIYDYIKEKTNIKNTLEISEYEVELEKKVLFRNDEMYEIYKYAKDNKKKVIVTSDMYLLYDDIEEILKNCGYDDIDKIYLSSKERKAKFDGTLYDFVKKDLDIDANKILHIGDNLKDDYNMALSKGFNAFHYLIDKPIKSDNVLESIHNGIVNLVSKNTDDFWVKLGCKAGLLYMALYNELLNRNNKKIYFLSRDGFNLYNLFKIYNKEIDGKYVYTSRRAMLLASITKIDGEALSILPPFTYGQTIREVLEYIGMENVFDEDDLKKVGFDSFEHRFKDMDEGNRFKEIYKIKEDEVLKICATERKYAMKYFKSLGMLEGKNLVFDCGWNGSSQYLLENFIHSEYPRVDFEFFYAGIFENSKSIRQLKRRKHTAYLFDIGYNQHIVSRIYDSIVILELFFGSPENSILKYDENGYVFDDFESYLDYKKKIYEGLEKYFKYAMFYFREFNLEINVDAAIKPLIHLIEDPTLEEAINIGNIENVDAFAKQKGIKKYIAKLTKEDIANNNCETYWKYGLLKRNDIDSSVKKVISKKYSVKIRDNFKIDYKIYGVNNPILNISGFSNYSVILKIKENGKDLDYKMEYDHKTCHFSISVNLLNNSEVEIYLIENDNEKLVKKLKNTKTSRLIFKIIYMMKLILDKLLYLPMKIIKKCGRILKKILRKVYHAIRYAWKEYHFIIPPKKLFKLVKKFFEIENPLIVNPWNPRQYRRWLKTHEKKSEYVEFDYQPLISFVIPVYNVSKKLLEECLNSILKQTYQNFEICLADDCSTNQETISTLKKYEQKDKRIKVVYREKNGHISNASNSALELVTGEYVAMMDNDDVIPDNALFEMVKALNEDKTIDMIYTDEDKLDFKGRRCDPHFKSNYAPDTLMSVNYFCHFTLLKTDILREIGGWKVGVEGAQDWDLFLRFTEKAKNIHHIPKILYHWRMIPGSTSMTLDNKGYAARATSQLLKDTLKRRKVDGEVHLHDKVPYYWIEYKSKEEPLVSIIIPTKDYATILDNCLTSIYEKNTYKNFEVIVVDNRSVEKETFELFEKYKKEHKNFRIVKADMEFNYSKINNLAVKEAKGDYILLLNNDTEVITENWLSLMVGYAMQSHVGAVGAKLLFPDKTIQHGGVVLGMGGVAGHAFVNAPIESCGEFGRLCVPYNYSVVTAACLMISKDKFNEVNGLNEELKVAYNDVDFCLKVQKAGYHNVMLPMVELFHYESKSRGLENTPEKMARFEKERKYMYEHWRDVIENDPMYNENLSRIDVFKL